MKIDVTSPENMPGRSSMLAVVVMVASLMVALFAAPAQAVIVFVGATSGGNDALPINGTAGPLTINKPAAAVAGNALIATIAARPRSMTVTVPAGWNAMTVTQQQLGGVSTLPGGMTLLTYYHIVGLVEPASYTWTFANPTLNQGGSAVGGILAFSGIDTATGNPIDNGGTAWSFKCTGSNADCATGSAPTLTHGTNSFNTVTANTMIVSSISILSASNFANPTGSILAFTERLDQSAPLVATAIGTTIQMSTAPMVAIGATGTATAVAANDADSGIGHMMALKAALIDPSIAMTRSGPLVPGGTASYTLNVTNLGINPEPGPISVVDTLPAGLTYNPAGSGGTGWVCGAVGQVVTCTRAGALAGGAAAAVLLLNVNVAAGTSGTKTNTATVSGTGGDGNTANNTATDSYTIAVDLALSMTRTTTLDPGQNATYTFTVNNAGTLTEPGAITLSDTLPAGLTYVSGTGTGWACSAVGQAVTCTRAGTLAGGATTATLTLTVAVATTASAITNTASVTGTGGDSSAANNSASDTYNIASDLSIVKARSAALVPGSNATYTLTVTNNGTNVSPQPIVITDTLPATLTFVSGTGTGWVCGAAGQVVTCTRNTVLAVGATSPVTLTVAVALAASGTTVSNTASVNGPATDATPANNSSTDSFAVPLATYAYYKMDEAAWTGAANEVLDASGNNRHATAVGGVSTISTPALGAKGDTCRGTDIPDDNTLGTLRGVNTGIDINSLGSAGTISFWYRSRLAWNTGGGNNDDRTLLDATGNANGEFWLVLQQNGALRFTLDNNGGTNQTATATAQAFAASTWHHVAITWDFTGNTMFIYADGAQVGNRSNGGVTSTANLGTLLVGDNQGTAFNPNRGNSADGAIDEVRIYASALTVAQIIADRDAAHACAVVGPNHYELSLPTSSISCLATTATVTACADATSPCTNKYAAASGTTATLGTSAGTLGATTVTFDATGVATTTLSHPAAADGAAVTLTLSGEAVAATSPRQCCPNGVSCVAANSCSTTFNTAGLIFSASAGGAVATIPAQVAGTTSGNFFLRAVRTSTTTKACEAALTGANTVNFGNECNNPTTCSGSNLMSVNGGTPTTIARNNNGSVTSFTSVPMTFDANGNAQFTFNYGDVGQVTLWANKTVNSAPLTISLNNAFVVRPGGFVLASNSIKQTAAPQTLNPASLDATDLNKFVRAGEAFSVTVTATTSGGATTPNYGRETAPESVKLTAALVPGLGLTSPPPISAATGFGAFSAGVATGTDFTWPEVGIITLTPSVKSPTGYLGAGDTTGTTTGNVGRFIPNHFTLTAGSLRNRPVACVSDPGFTYVGEPLRATFTLTAKNVGGTTTSNYVTALTAANTFAKLAGTDPTKFGFGAVDLPVLPATPTALTAKLAVASATSSGTSWTAGAATFTADLPLTRAAPEGPYESFYLGAIPADNDGVTLLAADLTLDTDVPANTNDRVSIGSNTKIRFGRLFVPNTYGTEKRDLTVPVEAQYWSGAFWQRNVLDSCPNVIASNITLGNYTGALTRTNLGTSHVSISAFSQGLATIALTKPGPAATGSVELAVNLGTAATGSICPSWTATASGADRGYLRGLWCGLNYDKDPVSRITFGVTPSRFIYNRENY